MVQIETVRNPKHIKIAVLALLSAAAPLAVHADIADDQQAGIVRLQCAPPGGGFVQHFRGAVVAGGGDERRFEIVLTTAHGLPDADAGIATHCSMLDAEGRRYAIAGAWRPPLETRADDWAVLLTEGPLNGALLRLRPHAVDDAARRALVANRQAIRLPLRTAGTEQACGFTEPDPAKVDIGPLLFTHDCLAWSGHSGSPVVLADDAGPQLVGIHLGSLWTFDRFESAEIGRFVDVAILDAIEHAEAAGIEAGESLQWTEGARRPGKKRSVPWRQ